jgi:hypothetical protein
MGMAPPTYTRQRLNRASSYGFERFTRKSAAMPRARKSAATPLDTCGNAANTKICGNAARYMRQCR